MLSPSESLEGSDDIVIAVDSTGVRVHKAVGWVERKYGKKKRYVKIFAVDVETKEALAMLVTTDGTHNSRAFPELLRRAKSHGRVSKVYGDGAFDSSRFYELLELKVIEAIEATQEQPTGHAFRISEKGPVSRKLNRDVFPFRDQ